jgi:hypothetical protein
MRYEVVATARARLPRPDDMDDEPCAWRAEGSSFVFTTRDGRPLDGGNVTRDLKRLLVRTWIGGKPDCRHPNVANRQCEDCRAEHLPHCLFIRSVTRARRSCSRKESRSATSLRFSDTATCASPWAPTRTSSKRAETVRPASWIVCSKSGNRKPWLSDWLSIANLCARTRAESLKSLGKSGAGDRT